jgi:hypothetical protein
MPRPVLIALAVSLAALPYASFSQASRDNKKHEKAHAEKNVWNYESGIFFQSDGDLPDGPCFRISGRAFSDDFFQDLKRFDYDETDSVFRRGKDTVTIFPEQLRLEFSIHDTPCSLKLDEFEARGYLTRPQIETLHVDLYWKRGVDLRPVQQVARPQVFVHPLPAPANVQAEGLQTKFEWFYVFDVASAGIPLTDSLVVVMRTPSGRIAARVAARM